jgi:hypothetical protein
MMSDITSDGLSKPLSYGEQQALAEQRKIDATRGRPFEDRDERLDQLRTSAGLKKVNRISNRG